MSHQNIVEAAVQAAAKQGIGATVIVLGANGSPPAAPPAAPEHVTVEHEHYVHASATEGEVGAKLAQAEQHIAAMTEQLAQRDQIITELRAAPPPPAAAPAAAPTTAPPPPAQPEETVSIDAYGVDVLGLSDDIAKKVRKVYPTIGALREAAAAGKLEDLKLKGGRKGIIEVQMKLLGKVPPERIPASAGGSAEATAAEGVPNGHTDRPWMDRLGAVKAKERDWIEWANKMAALRQQYPNEQEMPDEDYDKLQHAIHEHDIAKSQVIALVWGLGLDKENMRDGGSVDDCLRAAGLTHLTDSPQPRVAPEA